MKLRITLGKLPTKGWSFRYRDNACVEKLRKRLHEIFADYLPRRLSEALDDRDSLIHEMTIPDYAHAKGLLELFDQEVRNLAEPVGGYFQTFLDQNEVKRARFLQLFVYGDSVDDEPRGLNPIKHVLCESCRYPDLRQMPQPVLVNKSVLKKQDIFRGSTGFLVVRPHVLSLLQHAIGGQIDVGEAKLTGKKQLATGGRLFWVRPKTMIGEVIGTRFPVRCKVCNRPLESRSVLLHDIVDSNGPGLCDARIKVKHFGERPVDFAVESGYYGEIQAGAPPFWYWPMVISGRLFTFLKANGVKGFAVALSSGPANCYYSEKDEAHLETSVNAISPVSENSKILESAKAALESGRKLVQQSQSTPWNHDENGYVYLYLTTPEVMMMDPMTWEDCGEPYRIKNFDGPGLYRFHVKAIKPANEGKHGVAVDCATLMFVDNAFHASLSEIYEWDKAIGANGRYDRRYHEEIAVAIGNRYAICTAPPAEFKSSFIGDGFYTLVATQVKKCAKDTTEHLSTPK